MKSENEVAQIAIIGGGPAGLFAAKQLTENGFNVAIFNRDIKPGGLAEYGIYPEKTKLKNGLRCQFRQIIGTAGIFYYGNTSIGEDLPLGISDLKRLGFSAVLIAAGAQGTKDLELEGEDCSGVYHAKEIVYHYNHLPPYALRSYPIGKKVVVLGIGNVMTDIVRYLLTLPHVEEITTVARRGLAEVKFDKRELEPIVGQLDIADFTEEVARISPAMREIGQEPLEQAAKIEEVYTALPEKSNHPKWRLRFLYSPVEILHATGGVITDVRFEENYLEITSTGTLAKGTRRYKNILADTLIMAIGDQVDDRLGIPMHGNHYPLEKIPRFPMGGVSYELVGSVIPGSEMEGVFVCGWSRNASSGMVGIARKDGVNAAGVIQAYLAETTPLEPVRLADLEKELHGSGYKFVRQADLLKLEDAEVQKAQAENLSEYRFDSNEEMLKAMGM